MSELEFLKHNPDLKNYSKTFDKSFPKIPVNIIKVSHGINFKYLSKLIPSYNIKDVNPSLKFNYTKDGVEINPILKYFNGDKISFMYGRKNLTLEVLVGINYDTLKLKVLLFKIYRL
jgi:hypothetical protein